MKQHLGFYPCPSTSIPTQTNTPSAKTRDCVGNDDECNHLQSCFFEQCQDIETPEATLMCVVCLILVTMTQQYKNKNEGHSVQSIGVFFKIILVFVDSNGD